MATADVASGPQYAPEDPTLAKPWKGLIDGSTGVMYYWNPESNVTQYERPADPMSAPGAPPSVPMPKLAAIPAARSFQTNGQAQEMNQSYQSHGQQALQQQQPLYNPHHHVPQFGEDTQHQGTQQGVQQQQQGQQMAQGLQPNWYPMPQQSRDQPMQQPAQRMPQHLEQQTRPHEVQQPSNLQGQQFPGQQQQIPFQGMQGKQILQPQAHQSTYQQGPQVGFSHREELEFQRGKDSGFSQSSIQQPQQSFFQDRQQSGTPPVQSQQQGSEAVHQHNIGRSMFQPHQASTNMHDQRPGGPPMGSKVGYGDDLHGRPGNEFYFNPNKGGSVVVPHQSKMAPLPLPQNQMEMELRHHVTSGHANGSNSAMTHMKNPIVGAQPFTHNAAGVPPAIHGSVNGTDLSAADAYRREHEISATGDNVPAPFMTFEATGFPAEILREIHFAGFPSPTPIQAQTWPISLQSRDIVAIAKTGSGKTLGYLVPAFIHLRQCRPSSLNGPKVLILAPTRELATQIQDETVKFGRSSGISCTCLYGGAPKGPQIRDLDRGVDIVVATPGRLNDILEMKKIDFRQVSFLVLDEADRMLDMGFEPQIRKIVNEIPPHRQTLMYTATWPKEVRKIAGDLLVNPVQVNIGRVDELAANKSITQYVEVVSQMNKQRRLEQILRSQERGSKVIIFCSTKRLCDQLTRSIGRSFGAAAIHGDKSQGERDHVLNQFRSGKSPILVATDVAARGLDIKDIRMVINYDFPTGIEDYVHRIGRTGRAGATGVAYTFFSDQDRKHASDLVKVLEGANQLVPPELQEMAAFGRPSFVKNHNGIPRGDSRDGGFGGRGGMRDGGFGGRGDTRDGGFGGRGDTRDGGYGGRGDVRDGGFGGHGDVRDGGFGGRGGMRDGGFGGRGGARDDGFGGRRGRNDFGGRGNQGRGSSGSGRGFGRHDSGPPDRYNNDGRGQFNRRGIADGGRGRSFGRNHSANPDMVSTWDTRSSSSGRSSSRSRSRSRSRSLTRNRTRSRQRSRSRSRSRSPSRSRDGFRRAERATQESKFSSVSLGSAGAAVPGNHLPDTLPLSVDADQPNPEPGADEECADKNDP